MKRRGFKDTVENRRMARELGFSFIVNEKRKRIFIKLTSGDLAIVKEIMPD